MKILFLDFDGVLNSDSFFLLRKRREDRRRLNEEDNLRIVAKFFGDESKLNNAVKNLCPMACSNLQLLLEWVPDLKIVISSSWRMYYEVEELREILKLHFVDSSRVIDITRPKSLERNGIQRGDIILDWVLDSDHEVEKFAIVDDDNDMDAVRDNFFKINPWDGLTLSKVKEISLYFGVDPNPLI